MRSPSVVIPFPTGRRPPFTMEQRVALATWHAARQSWVRYVVSDRFEDADEAIGLILRGAADPRWWLRRTGGSSWVEVNDELAPAWDGRFVSLQEALAAIDAVAEAEWRRRPD